jgi:hypothetical protein
MIAMGVNRMQLESIKIPDTAGFVDEDGLYRLRWVHRQYITREFVFTIASCPL